MGKSKIEWTEETWNPIKGCSRVSPGCENCYAEQIAYRFDRPGHWAQGLTVIGQNGRPRWRGVVGPVPRKLHEPLSWGTPRIVFVNSMSDLFHEKIEDDYVAAVFGIMLSCPHHTFQVLTKRSGRMREIMGTTLAKPSRAIVHCMANAHHQLDKYSTEHYRRKLVRAEKIFDHRMEHGLSIEWPPENIWVGVSVEDAKRKGRIEDLRKTPAAVRFLSCEPLLNDLGELDLSGIRWVIVGGESGAKSRIRPMDLGWVRRIVDQCAEQEVAVFVKQLGTLWSADALSKDMKGGDMRDWPSDLRVREFPAVAAGTPP